MAETDAPEEAENAGERPALSPAAQRALAEAEARRAEAESRYGDWEKNGIASDF
jgi:hypothetical protein